SFYRKELRLRVSRSYGPGRYDPEYEEHGLDYPVGYVRWTERRNMEAVLDLMARGVLRPGPLTSHSFAFAEVQRAYDLITTSAERFGFAFVGDTAEVIDDPECDAVVIATRHESHAALAAAALQRGKAVFVEKPLGLTEEEIMGVLRAAGEAGGRLMVGFNRR